MLTKENKRCRDCAFLNFSASVADMNADNTVKDRWFPCSGESLNLDKLKQINEKELDSKSCRKFVNRKKYYSLDSQLRKLSDVMELHEQRKNNNLPNRLKRHWKFTVELIGVIGVIVAIIKLYLSLIHW
jgi:hypothetical protein